MKIDITTRSFGADDKIRTYVVEKVGGLEKYLPRQVRRVVSCTVTLVDDPNGREDNRYVCDVVMTVPGMTLVSREGTVNMFAAVDIVEAKLKMQIMKYKEKHALEPRRGRMLSRLLGRLSGSEPAA